MLEASALVVEHGDGREAEQPADDGLIGGAVGQADVEAARARAWVHYESIVLTSSEAVVMACIQVRKSLSNHVELLSTLSNDPDPNAQAKRENSGNEVYRALEKFHIAARKEMELPALNFELINEEIRRHYATY